MNHLTKAPFLFFRYAPAVIKMVKLTEHIRLARCRVLYLGSAVPTDTSIGLASVQKPLRERYVIDKDGEVPGIDAWLTIWTSGLQLQYVNDQSTVLWFPIQTLHVCAAVKCVEVGGDKDFISLDSPEASGVHPPMFAAVMRRTKGIKVLECHAFICKTNVAAMALVKSATHGFEHQEGWTDEPPPVDNIPDGVDQESNGRDLQLIPGQAEGDRAKISADFFAPPAKEGYFYISGDKEGLIKNYHVATNARPPPPPMATLPPPPRMPLPPPPHFQHLPPPPPHMTMRPPTRIVHVAPPPPPPPPPQPIIIQAPPPPPPPQQPMQPPIVKYVVHPNYHNGYFSDGEAYRQPPPHPVDRYESSSRRREPSPRRRQEQRSSSSSSEAPHRLPRHDRPRTPDADYFIYQQRRREPSPRRKSRRDQFEHFTDSGIPEYATRFPPAPQNDRHHHHKQQVPGPPLDPEWERHWYEYSKQRARSQPPPQNRKKRRDRDQRGGSRQPDDPREEYYRGQKEYGDNFTMRENQQREAPPDRGYDRNDGYPTERHFARSMKQDRARGNEDPYQMNQHGLTEDQVDTTLFENGNPFHNIDKHLGYFP